MNSTTVDHETDVTMKPILTLISFLVTSTMNVFAQPLQIDWLSVDGGGGTSAGGVYVVTGTIGQPDAGTMSGGPYAIEGGLWPGLIAVSPNAPTLYIQTAGEDVQLGWSPATAGFTLEITEGLGGPAWVPAPGGNPLSIPATGQSRFFRLRRP